MSAPLRLATRGLALLLCGAASVATAQTANTGEIHGYARDAQGRPLTSVTISLIGAGQVEADSAGVFRFINVPPGVYFLKATKLGLQPVMRNIDLADGEHLRVDIALDARAQVLSAVVVTADSAYAGRGDPTGFTRRMKSGQGTYISGDEIVRKGYSRTEYIFHGLPDVRVDTGGIILIARGVISFKDMLGGARSGSSDPRSAQFADCVGVQVFVDGALMPQPFNVNDVQAQSIKGIELYRGPATTPPELRSPKTVCGTVAIWTR